MNKKGFMFSQNLMDELGSLQGEVNSYSSQNSWTDSQSVDSQESGYQTSDYLPDSFLPRRSRPTLPRPPSCPTFATSQPPPIQSKFSASNRQENDTLKLRVKANPMQLLIKDSQDVKDKTAAITNSFSVSESETEEGNKDVDIKQMLNSKKSASVISNISVVANLKVKKNYAIILNVPVKMNIRIISC